MKNNLHRIEQTMQENWPECMTSTSLTLLKMTRLQDVFKQKIEACVTQYGLQHADFSVLVTLRRHPVPYCLSPTDLYKSMLFSSGGLTKVLGRLVEAELINRVDNPEDKRSKLVQLNEKGKKLVETIMPDLHQQNKTVLAGLSENEQSQLDSLLEKALHHHEHQSMNK